MEKPVLSIVICTRNRAKGLGDIINSLIKIESGYEWEAIFVDNASTDKTRQVFQGNWGLRWSVPLVASR